MAKSQKKPENFLEAFSQVNLRLKAGKIPVQVVLLSNGNKLGIQATMPDKNDPNARWHQQKISLGVPANIEGLEFAEAEARIVGGLLAKRQSPWERYQKQKPKEKPTYLYTEDAIKAFEENYFKCRVRTERSESTWGTDYASVFKKLVSPIRQKKPNRANVNAIEQPSNEPKPSKTRITVQRLLKVFDTTAPGTRSRQRDCTAIGALAEFLNLDLGVDLKKLEGDYSPKPRNIPSDEEIVKGFYKLPLKWRPACGMIATYGLRPYELPYVDSTDLDNGGYTISLTISKSSKKKAKTRRIYPYYREWIELFGLRNAQLPILVGRNSSERGGKVGRAFKKAGVGFVPYDLRHAWAIRLIAFGVPISVAAKQMDHSVKVHEETYEAWIPDDFNNRIFEASYKNSQRPKPPEVDILDEGVQTSKPPRQTLVPTKTL
jgi:integrase